MCKTAKIEPTYVPEPAPFTLEDIKKAIPAHCFKRSVISHFLFFIFYFSIIP
jgi:hypothetical protein